jgi:O-6-methylguanine DNA methyltransferase
MNTPTAAQNAIRHIIWDWNGTLLDDARACAAAVDALMRRRGIGGETVDGYRSRVRFPVRLYYLEAGFDLQRETYDSLCDEFGEAYAQAVTGQVPQDSVHMDVPEAAIHADAEAVLAESSACGITHAIVSASEQDALRTQVEAHGLTRHFQTLMGRTDNHGGTKDHLVRDWVKRSGYAPSQILYIGDSEHDYEAAASAGIRMALVCDGHVGEERLHRLGVPVYPNRQVLWEKVRPLTDAPVHHLYRFATPIGEMGLVTSSMGVVRVELPGGSEADMHALRPVAGATPAAVRAAERILDWLRQPEPVLDIPVSVFGTGFQRIVWQAVREIPFAGTLSYGELAMRIGRPGAARAVAQALRRNPTPLIVPCHRVVGADGTPTGFMGERRNPLQQWLLDLERKADSV